MKLITLGKPVDIAAVFPELAEFARTTVRLHPRWGEPTAWDSSLGGPLLWPADEAWPHCTDHQAHERSGYTETEPVPLVAVLQLYAHDVPELPFPNGTDICQVLWCPFVHQPGLVPRVELHWRSEVAVTAPLEAAPDPVPASSGNYLPATCLLHPERVTEYPYPGDPLPPELLERIWEGDGPWSYQHHLSVAPGTKVGGWVSFAQDPSWPDCAYGHPMDHLLTIASRESDGESWKTWTPVEEEALAEVEASPIPTHDRTDLLYRPGHPSELMIGDAGSLYVFVCTTCPDTPIIAWSDS
ncbi:hypothetical protein [Actinomadura hibisca]|uniref:hypothetical protein n=1 Tax=Actinomadura hibisca TaxID=68565 RepID=UPI0008366C57|nr:hypothetical protein [Actinomadura hibisca]